MENLVMTPIEISHLNLKYLGKVWAPITNEKFWKHELVRREDVFIIFGIGNISVRDSPLALTLAVANCEAVAINETNTLTHNFRTYLRDAFTVDQAIRIIKRDTSEFLRRNEYSEDTINAILDTIVSRLVAYMLSE